MKPGTKVYTPDGGGVVAEPIGKPPREGQILITINSDKYWPHWNIYYDIDKIRIKKQQ